MVRALREYVISKDVMGRGRQELPLFVYFLLPLGGPLVLFPFADRKSSIWFWLLCLSGAAVPAACMVFLASGWIKIFMIISGFNLSASILVLKIYPFVRRPFSRFDWPVMLRNSAAFLVIAFPAAVIYAGVERWITDWLWSAFYEVNFSLHHILSGFGGVLIPFVMLAGIISILTAKLKKDWSIEEGVLLAAVTALISLVVRELFYILIDIPQRQAVIAGIFPSWVSVLRHQAFNFIYFAGISLFIYRFMELRVSGRKVKGLLIRGTVAVALCVLSLSVLSGMPANYSFLLGRQYEKFGLTRNALFWYSKTLRWIESDNLKSYLQFHVGLLHRKNGNMTGLRESLTNVLLKYNANPSIVQKARRFQKQVEEKKDLDFKRVVIPGVEARTEYKAAYCVPNSLGLILNYWGDRVGARTIGADITKLDAGSYITDAAFYSESRDFKHYILPLCARQNIKDLIDADLPVLAFVPGHVIAIFGYDDLLETYITYDVATLEIWDERTWDSFEPEWNRSFSLLAVVVRDEKVPLVKSILGDDIDVLNEKYLQFLMAGLSRETISNRIGHLRRSTGSGLFFSDWEYEYYTGKSPEIQAPDSVVHEYLLKNGVENSTLNMYLQNLTGRGDYGKMAEFLNAYALENRLSPEMISIRSGSYAALGRPLEAVSGLISEGDFKDLGAVALEYMLGRPEIMSRPHLALQLSRAVLGSKPFDLFDGASASKAYSAWRYYSALDEKNVSESLNFVYHYLSAWNPMDRMAVEDIARLFELKKFNKDDKWNRELWAGRIEVFKANLVEEVE